MFTKSIYIRVYVHIAHRGYVKNCAQKIKLHTILYNNKSCDVTLENLN